MGQCSSLGAIAADLAKAMITALVWFASTEALVNIRERANQFTIVRGKKLEEKSRRDTLLPRQSPFGSGSGVRLSPTNEPERARAVQGAWRDEGQNPFSLFILPSSSTAPRSLLSLDSAKSLSKL